MRFAPHDPFALAIVFFLRGPAFAFRGVADVETRTSKEFEGHEAGFVKSWESPFKEK